MNLQLCVQTADIALEHSMQYACDLIKAAGFEALDWNFDHDAHPGCFDDPDYVSILEKPWEEIERHYEADVNVMKASGLAIGQSHAPFPATVCARRDYLERMIPIFENSLRLCAYAGCPATVIHGLAVNKRDGSTQAEIDELNTRLYTALIPAAKETGVTVLLEDLFGDYRGQIYQGHCANPHEAADFIDRLNDEAGFEAFGLCFDVGHLFLYGGDMLEYLRVMGPRIKALHIHDNMGQRDDHRAPYTGIINWPDFIQGLRDISYRGNLSFETFAQTRAEQIPAELIPAWLELIAKEGAYFRNEILK